MAGTRTNKTKNEWVSWKNRPYDSSRSDETQRRAEWWGSFNNFIRENQAWLITPPGSRTAVVEVMKGSPLPARLMRIGYTVNEIPGTYERLTGAQITPAAAKLARQGHAIDAPGPVMAVERFEVVLPWGAPPPPPMKRPAPC